MFAACLLCLRKYIEKRKQEDYEETDADIVLQTAVEAEDLWEEQLNSFKPASRTTGLVSHSAMKVFTFKNI